MAFLPLAVLAACATCTMALGAESGSEAARLNVFSHPDGATYFALSLKPTVEAAVPDGTDVVILFDTSSSQTGIFRENALTALDSLLAGLGPKDRVKIFAVDLNAIAMNGEFAAPGSREIADAVGKLKSRVPLGATNMEAALTTAAASFSGATKPRACVYVGDGMSAANVLGTDEFDNLVTTLVDSRVPVSSYAVGPRLDGQMLGALAGRTGGDVVSQDQVAVLEGGQQGMTLSPAEAGRRLAKAADGVVYWPVAVELPKDRLPEVLPVRMPPLRADRESVLIGELKGDGPLSITMTANTPDGAKQLSWEVAPGKSDKQYEFLGKLIELARPDGGMSLPLVGEASLRLVKDVSDVGAENLADLAREAVAIGNLDRARQLAEEVLRRKPEDRGAKALLAEIDQRVHG
ncbi:MAG: hypothetical protein JW719_05565, partial [Pirellulales bacterium]|nr:hypothetical protein [Pirellulales bacterium]